MAKSSRAKWIPDIFDVVEGFVTPKTHPNVQWMGPLCGTWQRQSLPKRGCWLSGRVQSREFERGKLIRLGIRLPGTDRVIEVSRWRKVKAKEKSHREQ